MGTKKGPTAAKLPTMPGVRAFSPEHTQFAERLLARAEEARQLEKGH